MTQEEANKLILEHWSKEGLAKGWVEEHIKYNAIKEENLRLKNIINKAIEYIENNEYVDLALIRNEINGKCDKISKNGLIKKQPILDILKGEK